MLDNGPNFTVATFIRRGPSKRRRGGQLRTLEKYTSNELQILRGGALCSLDRKQGYIVPSALTSQYMLPILERISSLYSQSKTQLLFMETVLRHATERADASTLRQVKNLLCDSLACYTALNEQCAKLYSAPSPGEAFPDHAARLMAASVLYITSNIGVPITVLVVDAADPLASHCAVLGLASLSIAEYIHQQVATRALPPAIEAETQELLAHYLSCLAAPASMEQAEYPAHLTAQEAERGLASGALCVGTLATYRHDNSEGEVEVTARVAGAPALVLLSGRLRLNRALDGDEVVLRVLPRDQWTALSSRVLTEEAGEDARGASPPRGTALDVPFGEVVAIRRRAPRQIIATLPLQRRSVGEEADDTDREEHLLVAPVDRRLPKIRIRTRQRRALEHQRFLVEIDSWQRESRFPHGHFVRILGDRRDWRVEVECLLLEHSITPRPFSTAALAHLPNIPGYDPATRGPHQWVDSNYALPADRLAGRRDMRRSHFVFSVDPPGCQDIDDAMSLQWLSPGRIEVAVHIADVCAFVPHNSALDLEARERATTVYLTHERYDMLPSLISSDIASLHGDKDRFTVSVAWEIAVTHADGSPVLDTEDFLALDEARNIRFNMPELPTWCGRGIIHSEVAATYQQAHNLIYDIAPDPAEDKVPLGQAGRAIPRHKWRRLRQDLRGLMVFSRSLLRARESNGALDLSQGAGAELKFKVDAEGSPVQVQGKEELEIHHTISELMIVANSAVASIIYAAEPLHTLLRIHPPPSTEKLKLLQAQILETGLDIFQQSSSTAEVREGLRSYREKMSRQKSAVQDPEQAVELLTSVVIRAMNEAKYVGSSALSGELLVASMSDAAAEGKYIGHYGLGLRFYTHFTSPIRRYADVIVHRQLLSVLASKATAQIVPAPPEPMKAATPVKPATTDDDLDFLDSLLDGVGDELVVPAPPAPESESTIESARTTTKNTPFTDSELFKISEHLNTMNRRAKACQFGCQKLFLCLYFTNRVEQHRALIFALRENGFM